jgi:hypothetical protein
MNKTRNENVNDFATLLYSSLMIICCYFSCWSGLIAGTKIGVSLGLLP